MKQLFFFFALSLSLILSACSNTEDTSPISPQFNKTSVDISYPFGLYQTFPELKGVKVDWYNNAKGLVITVSSPIKSQGQAQLFAVVEFADVDPVMEAVQMVYLGNFSKGIYLVRGIKNRTVSSVKIYLYNNSNLQDRPGPYPEYQLFNSVGIKGWSAGVDAIKISSEKFPNEMKHLFAELTAVEGNTLVFLGKPRWEDFEFPKSPKLNVSNVRLLGYMTGVTANDAFPIVDQQ
jgi:hypothetical protein